MLSEEEVEKEVLERLPGLVAEASEALLKIAAIVRVETPDVGGPRLWCNFCKHTEDVCTQEDLIRVWTNKTCVRCDFGQLTAENMSEVERPNSK